MPHNLRQWLAGKWRIDISSSRAAATIIWWGAWAPSSAGRRYQLIHLAGGDAGAAGFNRQGLQGEVQRVRTQNGGDLQMDQLRQAIAGELWNQLTGTAAIE